MLSKILENIVSKQMFNYFSRNGLFTKAQYAYRPRHSTSTALVHMTDQWLTYRATLLGIWMYIADRKIVGAVLFLAWMKSYLSDRTQQVFFSKTISCNDSARELLVPTSILKFHKELTIWC